MDYSIRIPIKNYRNIFIVQNRDFWDCCPYSYVVKEDLVLSFDFAVVRSIMAGGGNAQYIDHLIQPEPAEFYNHKTYEFFNSWHNNNDGKDIFVYKNVEFGSVFRLAIWNDVTYYVRLFLSVLFLKKNIPFVSLYVGVTDPFIINILTRLNIGFSVWNCDDRSGKPEYSFPVFRLFNEALNPRGIKYKVRLVLLKILDLFFLIKSFFTLSKNPHKHIYIESYNPTRSIISKLRTERGYTLVRSDFNGVRDIFSAVHLPVFVSAGKSYHKIRDEIILKFMSEKSAVLMVDNYDISEVLYELIIPKVSSLIPNVIKLIDVLSSFWRKRNLVLMVTISSIGIVNKLMINYCHSRRIPVFMIINGWLGNSFLNEAKDGTWINSYSQLIKDNYFRGMQNVAPLGDPRMDKYACPGFLKSLNRSDPVIGIGTSIFSNVDLNSFLAVEFEFLSDIMAVLKDLSCRGRMMRIIIKVRQNNYISQYRDFLNEYFQDMHPQIFQNIPMDDIYSKTDLYISHASQTLIEASCLGIPVIYYKNDNHFYDVPFNGSSELVTVFNKAELAEKIDLFYSGSAIFDKFREKEVLEKYIGPLDGRNLERNMEFIRGLAGK